MDIRPIQNDDDHRVALAEIDRLWGAAEGSPEGDKLDVLATLVEVYERTRWPLGDPTPRDMLEYAVTDMGRSQTELGELLGSRSLASELLAGKRRISLDVAQKVSAAWRIPIQLLVAPYAIADGKSASRSIRGIGGTGPQAKRTSRGGAG